MKTIQSLINQIEDIPEFYTIYAKPPWTQESEANLKIDPEGESNPFEAEGLEYFLEVFICQEMAEDMKEYSLKDRCERIIHYAINDA